MEIPFLGAKLSEIEILELLENYLILNNDPKVIEEFAETLREKGRKKEADILELLLDEIRRSGRSIIEVLNDYKLIKPDTYQFLVALESASMLTVNLVRELKEQKIFLARTDRELRGLMYQPLLSIFLTFGVGVYFDKQAFNLYKTFQMPIPDYYIFHKWLIEYPLIAIPVGLILLSAGVYFTTKWFINKQLGKERKLFEVASVAYLLTKAKVSLRGIFNLLADYEKSKKWRNIFIEISENYAEEFKEQLKPLLKLLKDIISVRFVLTAERNQAEAWKFLKEEMKFEIKEKVEKTKTNFETIISFLPWLFILIIAMPFFEAILTVVSKAMGGGF